MPNQKDRNVLRPLGSIALLLAASACSGETINLGENTSNLESPESSCPAGVVIARNQADVDALAGCEVLDGLQVVPFEGADLRSLSSLREVRGALEFGIVIVEDNLDDEALNDQLIELFTLLDAGWLFSLEGLESLERSGHLSLNGFAVDSLEPLSNLSALTANGGLQLVGCGGLRDLTGLENVVGLQSLEISCDNLESLAGLPFPDSMNTLSLNGLALKDLGELDLQIAQSVLITGTGLENLAGLELLITADAVDVSGNPELVDTGALNGLLAAEFLNVSDNASLERLPELDRLTRIDTLIVADNPLLENVPTLPLIESDFESQLDIGLQRRDLLTFRLGVLDVRNNPALGQLVLPAGLQAAGLVTIENNASLESISFSDVFAADFVSIANNPALSSVDLGALARVDELDVSGNPELDLTVFDTLQTFESELSAAPADAP